MAGSYVNPGWVNGAAPALEKTNLDNMSNAIVQNQTDISNLQTLTQDYNENKTQLGQNTNAITALKAHLLVGSNLSIASGAWVSDTTYSSEGYAYRATIPVTGATASYATFVNFNPADAASGNFAPVSAATANGVYVYAKVKPTAATPIISVICMQQTT